MRPALLLPLLVLAALACFALALAAGSQGIDAAAATALAEALAEPQHWAGLLSWITARRLGDSPGLARDELRAVRRLQPLALGAPEPNPWFEEKILGTTWLRRRPAVLTVAMVVVLAIVAAVVLTERGRGRG